MLEPIPINIHTEINSEKILKDISDLNNETPRKIFLLYEIPIDINNEYILFLNKTVYSTELYEKIKAYGTMKHKSIDIVISEILEFGIQELVDNL